VVALDVDWPARHGLLDIEHLTHPVVVRINRRHPFGGTRTALTVHGVTLVLRLFKQLCDEVLSDLTFIIQSRRKRTPAGRE
jgi:hypothetical protein